MKKPLRLAMAQINVVVGDIYRQHREDRGMDRSCRRVAGRCCYISRTGTHRISTRGSCFSSRNSSTPILLQWRTWRHALGISRRSSDSWIARTTSSMRLPSSRAEEIAAVYHKMFLPNYGVFDEFRYFQAGRTCPVFRIGDATVGISICEDIWYPDGPFLHQSASGGAEILINISSSPYHAGKRQWRERMLQTQGRRQHGDRCVQQSRRRTGRTRVRRRQPRAERAR